jgi:hypothetical protein
LGRVTRGGWSTAPYTCLFMSKGLQLRLELGERHGREGRVVVGD